MKLSIIYEENIIEQLLLWKVRWDKKVECDAFHPRYKQELIQAEQLRAGKFVGKLKDQQIEEITTE